MLYRDFTPDDRETYLQLSRDFYTTEAVDHPLPEAYRVKTFDDAVGGNPHMRGMLLLDEDRPAGYCLLSFGYSSEMGGEIVMIEEVYIDPAFQGRGIGGKVLGALFEEYKNKAAFRLDVTEKNRGAIKLYEKLGFFQVDYLCMFKDLQKQ